MSRPAFITGAEFVEITGSSYSPSLIEINESSELIAYYLKNNLSSSWTDENCPELIKLATAYQLLYMTENNDNEYGSQSFSIGKFSQSQGMSGEYAKISPKARRYCLDSGYVNRIV